jgi:hypothetical protein
MQDWGYSKYKDKLNGNQMLQDFNRNDKTEHTTGDYEIKVLLYWNIPSRNPANSQQLNLTDTLDRRKQFVMKFQQKKLYEGTLVPYTNSVSIQTAADAQI